MYVIDIIYMYILCASVCSMYNIGEVKLALDPIQPYASSRSLFAAALSAFLQYGQPPSKLPLQQCRTHGEEIY